MLLLLLLLLQLTTRFFYSDIFSASFFAGLWLVCIQFGRIYRNDTHTPMFANIAGSQFILVIAICAKGQQSRCLRPQGWRGVHHYGRRLKMPEIPNLFPANFPKTALMNLQFSCKNIFLRVGVNSQLIKSMVKIYTNKPYKIYLFMSKAQISFPHVFSFTANA